MWYEEVIQKRMAVVMPPHSEVVLKDGMKGPWVGV